jgi:hypothetical protein
MERQNDSSVQRVQPVQPTPVQHVQHTQEKDNTNYWFLGGALAIGGIAVGLTYFIQRGETIQPVQVPVKPVQAATPVQTDVFDMA